MTWANYALISGYSAALVASFMLILFGLPFGTIF